MLMDLRVRQRDYLLEIAKALTQELDLDILLERILKLSIEMLVGKAGLIALRMESVGWKIQVAEGLPSAYLGYIQPLLAKIPTDSNNPEQNELPDVNHLFIELTESASLGMLVGVGLPLVTRQKLVGVIYIFRGYQGPFSANDQAVLSSFADQAAIAVQNAQLYNQITQEKQRLGALLNSAADGILILSPNMRIERTNPAFAHLFSMDAQDLLYKHHEEVIQWAKPPHGLTLEQAEAGGWPLTPLAQLYVEGDLKRPQGQMPLPVGITYAPLFSADGSLLNIIVTIRDITRFRQADELKSTFISIISHELKTPVALIKGYVGTLRREDARWDKLVIEDSLKVIEEEADRLTLLIENLLDASRLQAGGVALKRSEVDLLDLAKRLAVRFKTQTTRHSFVVDFPDDFPVILGDETRLSQVLSNMLSNAIKYAAEGEIRLTGQVLPDTVILGVSDLGPGIAPKDIPHVFDRFYRSPDMARHTKGAGLGLFLSRAIVEAHSGRMWVDTTTDKGTRICFSLPR